MDGHSWKGHNFTLLIFGGVVVLCSIFFILGMLVGRAQLPTIAEVAATDETPPEESPEDVDLRFYETVEESELPPLESAPGAESAIEAAVAPVPLPPEPAALVVPQPAGEVAITLQIAALSNPDQAETLRAEIAEKGFPAFVVRPAPDDQSALHRVQVGPFTDEAEVERIRALLENEGYQPIVRN